ncbi:MAG: 4Fe-4S binding protein [Candidatus Helarchaeota archaeon]|nr:4Fe-4S binding protein [Candidatus Helarchaeota archaeon]
MEKINLKEIVTREGDPGDFIIHVIDNCTGCGSCILICPVNIWRLEKGKSVLAKDYKERCMECGSCETVCDYNAIQFSFPKGGTGIKYLHG